MNTKPIIPPKFMGRAANIIEELRNRSRINDVDAEVIEAMLKDALNEYYDAGHSDGYDDGYENGYADCHAKNSY